MIENSPMPTKFKTDEVLAAEYLVRQALTAGIPVEHIGLTKEHVRSKLDEPWMHENKCQLQTWLDDIYNIHSSWSKTRTVILIDGGSSIDRAYVGQAFLYRAIVNNACKAMSSALTKRSDELVTGLSQWGESRSAILENMSDVQCLLISEVSGQAPNSAALGNIYFNELFQNRQEANRPTILTFTIPDIEKRSHGEFSRLLDEIIKQQHSPLRRVYRFRLTT